MEDIFTDAARKLLEDHCTRAHVRSADGGNPVEVLWKVINDAGFADLGVPEESGGAGAQLADLFGMASLCGEFAIPVALSETIWARAILCRVSGALVPREPVSLALGRISGGHVLCSAVGYGMTSAWALVQVEQVCRMLPLAKSARVATTHPLEASVRWPIEVWQDSANIPFSGSLRDVQAMLTSGHIAGALRVVLQMSMDYANERQQFGKPIGRFQAIQHQLSEMAEHVVAAQTAARLAFVGQRLTPEQLRVAIGKARTSEAACVVAALAHAVHGAIGITHELDLQLYTRRLHGWRALCGSESYWHDCAANALFAAPPESAWDVVRAASNISNAGTN